MHGLAVVSANHALSIAQYVDEVIIGAPYSVTKDVLEKVVRVDVVAHGVSPAVADINDRDPYEVRAGIRKACMEAGHLTFLPNVA